jgi:hypothetical protein
LIHLGQQVQGKSSFNVWVKTVIDRPKVYVAVNNNIIYAREGNGVHDVPVDADSLTAGSKRVRVYVYDQANRFVSTAATTITVGKVRLRGGQPLQVSGAIQRYYVNRAGLVCAMDIETLGAIERIYFDTAQATQITTAHPENSQVTAWVLPRTDAEPAPGVAVSWDLVGTGEGEPVFNVRRSTFPGDIEILETGEAPTATADSTTRGLLTDVVTNPAGDVVALVIGNKTLVRVPRSLRASGNPTANATSLALGMPVSITGATQALNTGEISMYPERMLAGTVSVGGQPATALKYSAKATRGIRAVAREDADEEAGDKELAAAQSEGLDVYVPPLHSRSRFVVRSTNPEAAMREVGVEPLVNPAKRPW